MVNIYNSQNTACAGTSRNLSPRCVKYSAKSGGRRLHSTRLPDQAVLLIMQARHDNPQVMIQDITETSLE